MVHEVDAPDGSGCLGLVSPGVVCLGLVPEELAKSAVYLR